MIVGDRRSFLRLWWWFYHGPCFGHSSHETVVQSHHYNHSIRHHIHHHSSVFIYHMYNNIVALFYVHSFCIFASILIREGMTRSTCGRMTYVDFSRVSIQSLIIGSRKRNANIVGAFHCSGWFPPE